MPGVIQRTTAFTQDFRGDLNIESTLSSGVWSVQAMIALKDVKGKCMSDRGVDLVKLDGELRMRNFTVEIKETKHNDGTRPISKGCLEQLRHKYIMCTGYCGKVMHKFVPSFQINAAC